MYSIRISRAHHDVARTLLRRRSWYCAYSPRFLSITTNKQQQHKVGIFLDLDNIQTSSIPTRSNVAKWIRPIKDFGTKLGTIDTLQGFGNVNTQTWFPKHGDEEQDKDDDMQEWLQPNDKDDLYPGATVQTGLDKDGNLRCGVCGAKMKLTKKDKKRGWTVHDKLHRHMKLLHDGEQRKRLLRISTSKKKKNKLSQKEQIKFKKYKAAQVGLRRITLTSKGDVAKQKRNDLFQILREEGAYVKEATNVDEKLVSHANKWIDQTAAAVATAQEGEEGNNVLFSNVLIVVSGDSDFGPLLETARERGMLAVSVNPIKSLQTSALVDSSDIVLAQDYDNKTDKDCLRASAPTEMGQDTLTELESPMFPMELRKNVDSKASFHDYDSTVTALEPTHAQHVTERETTEKKRKAKVFKRKDGLLDSSIVDISKRNAFFIEAYDGLKKIPKKERLLRAELQIRLEHKGAFDFKRKNKASSEKLAVRLHRVEFGESTKNLPGGLKLKGIGKKSYSFKQKQLAKRGLDCSGNNKRLTRRLTAALNQEYMDEWNDIIRQTLVDRGLRVDKSEGVDDRNERLALSALGLELDQTGLLLSTVVSGRIKQPNGNEAECHTFVDTHG